MCERRQTRRARRAGRQVDAQADGLVGWRAGCRRERGGEGRGGEGDEVNKIERDGKVVVKWWVWYVGLAAAVVRDPTS